MSDFDYANDSMLEMYLFESTTLLDQLDEILLQSEKEGNLSSDNVNEIFRIMHTIKGSSAMMEFDTISHVSHKLEDLFYVIRDNGIDQDYFQELFDLVLEVSDFLKEEVEKIRQGQRPSGENESLISDILDLLDRMKGGTPVEVSAPAAAQAPEAVQTPAQEPEAVEEDAIKEDAVPAEGSNTYHLHVNFTADCQMENIRAFMLVNKLENIGTVAATIPEELNTNPDASAIISQNGFYCSLITDLQKEEISAMAKGTLSVYTVEFIDALPTISSSPTSPGSTT
jgi:two-component system chemotaxis sensor kinase CheA